MSALKFSQIQDMLINLATRMTRVEAAAKANGAGVADALEKISNLQEEVNNIEEKEKEKEAVKAGKWKSGKGETETEGNVYVMINNTDTPTDGVQDGEDPEPEPDPDPEPVVGATSYNITIDKIPSYTPASKDSDATYIFTPSEAFGEDVAPDFSKYTTEIQVTGTQTTGEGEQAVTREHVYTLSYVDGTFVLTTDLSTAEKEFIDDGAETPAIVEVVFGEAAITLTDVPKKTEEPVTNKRNVKNKRR